MRRDWTTPNGTPLPIRQGGDSLCLGGRGLRVLAVGWLVAPLFFCEAQGVPMNRAAASLAILILLPAPSWAKDAKEEAKEHFDKGVQLFKAKDFDGALVEFRAAYKAQPHYAVRYNVGITLYKLHRYGRAAHELQAYLIEGEGKIPDDKLAEVNEILAELQARVGSVDVECNVEGASVLVDGEHMDRTPVFFPLTLDVGEHEIEIHADGYVPFKKKIDVPGGTEQTLEVELVPGAKAEKARKKLPKGVFFGGLGVTGALALSAAITGGLALKTQADYRELDAEDDWKPVQRKAKNLALATDVLWGVAGAAAITTVMIAIFTDFEGGERKEAGLTLTPTIGTPGLICRGTRYHGC